MPSEVRQRLKRKKSDEKLNYKITRIIIAVVLIAAIFLTAGRMIATTSIGNQAESAQQSVTVSSDKDGATEDGGSNNDPKAVPVILKWIGNIAGILAVAIMTSGVMYLYYRKKFGRIEPLPVLFSEEERHEPR